MRGITGKTPGHLCVRYFHVCVATEIDGNNLSFQLLFFFSEISAVRSYSILRGRDDSFWWIQSDQCISDLIGGSKTGVRWNAERQKSLFFDIRPDKTLRQMYIIIALHISTAQNLKLNQQKANYRMVTNNHNLIQTGTSRTTYNYIYKMIEVKNKIKFVIHMQHLRYIFFSL